MGREDLEGGWAVRLRSRLADPTQAASLAGRARARRWQMFASVFPAIEEYTVLDLGGTPDPWMQAPTKPRRVVLVNQHPVQCPVDWMESVVADACDPPLALMAQQFDLVYSNSLMEHIIGFAMRAAFARVVQSAAPRFWVQTPNRAFPIEPHFLFPSFQHLPVGVRARIAQHWPLAHEHERMRTHRDALHAVMNIELLARRELACWFPDAEIVSERFCGLTKSLVAVRRGPAETFYQSAATT